MGESITIVFENMRNKTVNDIETPIDITLGELIGSIESAYGLGIDVSNVSEDIMVIENPICLLKTERTLEELGFRQGTTLILK